MISVSSVLTKNIIKSGEANENINKERGKAVVYISEWFISSCSLKIRQQIWKFCFVKKKSVNSKEIAWIRIPFHKCGSRIRIRIHFHKCGSSIRIRSQIKWILSTVKWVGSLLKWLEMSIEQVTSEENQRMKKLFFKNLDLEISISYLSDKTLRWTVVNRICHLKKCTVPLIKNTLRCWMWENTLRIGKISVSWICHGWDGELLLLLLLQDAQIHLVPHHQVVLILVVIPE